MKCYRFSGSRKVSKMKDKYYPVPLGILYQGYLVGSCFVRSSTGKISRYFYVSYQKIWVRGFSRVIEHLNSEIHEYRKILELGKCISSGKSTNTVIKELKISGNYIRYAITKYSTSSFYPRLNNLPVLNKDEIINSLLDHYYCNTNIILFPNTRDYLRKDLNNDILSRKDRGLILKEDLILNTNNLYKEFEYDFTNVPDILKSSSEEFILICKSPNPNCLEEEVGKFKTTFGRFIIKENIPRILRTYFISHSIEDYLNLINNWEDSKKKKSPIVPISLYRPLIMSITIRRPTDSRKTDTFWYVPELGKWINSMSKVRSVLQKLGLSFLEWENRWILKLQQKELFSENWLDQKINIYYSDKGEGTKKYIKDHLKNDPCYQFKGYIHKDDFINEYIKSKKLRKFIFDYQFDEVPEIIPTTRSKFIINCTNVFDGSIIGRCSTNYDSFINKLDDPVELRKVKLSKLFSTSFLDFLEKIGNKYDDMLDFSVSCDFKNMNTSFSVACKKCGRVFKVHPSMLLGDYFGCCFKLNRSKGEIFIHDWLVSNNITFQEEFTLQGVSGRNGENSSVRVDFYTEYQGRIYIIEYNGVQHYKYIPYFHKDSIENFNKQVDRDTNVYNYCIDNDIILVTIPYTYSTRLSINNLLFKIFVDNFSPEEIISLPNVQNLKVT